MATRNRNRTQRKNKNKSNKNKNKNRSNKNRNRNHHGGAASMSCNEAASINANPNSYGMVKKMAAKVQLKSCANGMKTVAPNQKWATKGAFIRPNTVTSRCEEENPDGTCKDNLMHRSPELNM